MIGNRRGYLIYKVINNFNPSFKAEVFVTKDVAYNLRGSSTPVLPEAKTNLYGIDTVRFTGQKIMADSAKKKSKSSKHWGFLKEMHKITNPYRSIR